MNSNQKEAVIEYFENYSLIEDSDERREDAEIAADDIDSILSEYN
ncbi:MULTISPECIES: hypothetical protein [Companilactobacillus]|nr:hypothetical protein [Companilactobacillus nantensis]GEO64450.1 hypothetical protein LNA01_16330 [Companilactobacillus nantensis]